MKAVEAVCVAVAPPKGPGPAGSPLSALIAFTLAANRQSGIRDTQPLARPIRPVMIGSRNRIPTPMAIPGMAERPMTANRNPIKVNGRITNKVRQNWRNWCQR